MSVEERIPQALDLACLPLAPPDHLVWRTDRRLGILVRHLQATLARIGGLFPWPDRAQMVSRSLCEDFWGLSVSLRAIPALAFIPSTRALLRPNSLRAIPPTRPCGGTRAPSPRRSGHGHRLEGFPQGIDVEAVLDTERCPSPPGFVVVQPEQPDLVSQLDGWGWVLLIPAHCGAAPLAAVPDAGETTIEGCRAEISLE